jgi:hypothetical protein
MKPNERIIARRLTARAHGAPGTPELWVPQVCCWGKPRADQGSPASTGGVCGALESRCFPASKTQNNEERFQSGTAQSPTPA